MNVQVQEEENIFSNIIKIVKLYIVIYNYRIIIIFIIKIYWKTWMNVQVHEEEEGEGEAFLVTLTQDF